MRDNPTAEEAALNSLCTRVQSITKANGFRTDIGMRVFDGWYHIDEKEAARLGHYFVITENLESGPYQSAGDGSIPQVAAPGTYQWSLGVTLEAFITVEAHLTAKAGDDKARELMYDIREDSRAAILASEDAYPTPPKKSNQIFGADNIVINSIFTDRREAGTAILVLIFDVELLIPECHGIPGNRRI